MTDPTCEAVAEELGAINDEIGRMSEKVREADRQVRRALVLFVVAWTGLVVALCLASAK